MDRTTLITGLLLTAGAMLAFSSLGSVWTWWRSRKGTTAEPAILMFGSDDPAPKRAIEFNQALVNACGTQLTAEEKLKILTTPNITLANALHTTRGLLEQRCVALLPLDSSAPEAR